MRTVLLLLVSFAVAAASPASAAEPFCGGGPHAIDVDYAADVARSNGVTPAMREAQGRANVRWDAELNRVYRDLLAVLDDDAQAALRKAQRAWLAFRDSELAFVQTEAIAGGGTTAPLVVNDLAMEQLRQRTCVLMQYRRSVVP